jgi:hypothetical protein
MSNGKNRKRWPLALLLIIPAAVSLFTCFVILPLVSALRNLALYNYFSWESFWVDAPYLLVFGFLPLFLVLTLLTALGWGIYLKLKKVN